MSESSTPDASDLPVRIGRPALRALAAAGVSSLQDVSRLRDVDLLRMHGVGPRALSLLEEALTREGLSLRSEH
ncbi:DNA-binding protein [Kineococcus sp. T13]|uniref:DNA-binding protein n=1 Tax=Kineococcus vitellinus TaxID=2696565 RepID=UPI00141260B8|nr:DNA-binding protein [Kineococcus vitellinus]NAZ76062.1 DNA-binding protein [Kineococcus vitellinus]